MKHLLKSLLILSIIMTSSCTNELTDVSIEPVSEVKNSEITAGTVPINDEIFDTETVKTKEFKFVYKNKEYSSFYEINSSSEMVLSDPEVCKLYNEIKSIPTLATEYGKGGMIYFYDTEADFIKALNAGAEVEKQTRMILDQSPGKFIRSFAIRMWDKPKGRKKGGDWIEYQSGTRHGMVSPPGHRLPDLKNVPMGSFEFVTGTVVDFDNRISSIQMWAEVITTNDYLQAGQGTRVVVTFYSEPNFKGYSYSFTEMTIYYPYSEIDYFEKTGIDDQASSYIIYYTSGY